MLLAVAAFTFDICSIELNSVEFLVSCGNSVIFLN
uniref:Uncharacterized protein n=1 Tax=Rhizophora mucronata TaxID=61149 RepID=A0A2P2R2H5_RHIMU